MNPRQNNTNFYFVDYGRENPRQNPDTYIPPPNFRFKNNNIVATNNHKYGNNPYQAPPPQKNVLGKTQYYKRKEEPRSYNLSQNEKRKAGITSYNNNFGTGAMASANEKRNFEINRKTQEMIAEISGYNKYVGNNHQREQNQARPLKNRLNPFSGGGNEMPIFNQREEKMIQKKNDANEQKYQGNIMNNNGVEGKRAINEENNNIKRVGDNLGKTGNTNKDFEKYQGVKNTQKGNKILNDDNTNNQINTNKNLLSNDINPSINSETNKESKQAMTMTTTAQEDTNIQDDKPKGYSEIELKNEYESTCKEIQDIQKEIFFDTQKIYQLSNSIINKNYNIEREKKLMDINEKLKQKCSEKITKNNLVYGQYNALLNIQINDIKTDIEKIKSNKKNIDNSLKELTNLGKEINDLVENKKKEEENFILYYEKKRRNGEIITRGLSNVGATCYMNSTLQCLSNVSPLTDYLLDKNKSSNVRKELSNKKNLIYYYKEVIENLWEKNRNSPYAPQKFKEILSEKNELFKGITANDSKDLILYLLETFHTELNLYKEKDNFNNENIDQTNEKKMFECFKEDYIKKNNSIISELFHGILKIKSVCNNCFRKNYTYQSFNLLEFPLEETVKFVENRQGKPYIIMNNNNKVPFLNIIECFEHYRAVTMFAGDNQMYCNNCNKNSNAFYYNSIIKAPNFLVIILNRGKAAKYDCMVNFGKNLDIEDYVEDKDEENIYELIGVIVHYGPSSMSGHFIAYCINRTEQSWYKYNDASVERCNLDNEYLNGMPYILFYRKIKNIKS